MSSKEIKDFLENNSIIYSSKSPSEFIIKGLFEMRLTGLEKQSDSWICEIKNVNTYHYLRASDDDLNFVLEIVKSIFFEKFQVKPIGLLNRSTGLFVEINSSYIFVGKIIDNVSNVF